MRLPFACVFIIHPLIHLFRTSPARDLGGKDDQPLSVECTPQPRGLGATSHEKCVKVGLVSEPTGVRVSFCIE